MYDHLHKEEFGYKKEDYKKVYLIFYNLFQCIGFIYILSVMGIRYYRDGSELTLYSLNAAENSGLLKQRCFPEDYRRDSKQCSRSCISIAIHTQSCALANASHHSTLWPGNSIRHTYEVVGNPMKFIQILQILEIMHLVFDYTRGNPLITTLQVGGRAFILFFMIEAEPRMQTKPVVFYIFIVWSVVEVIRYPYYMTNLLNVKISALTWLRYTIWMPLYPLGFVFEGIIVLRNIPYFEETEKFTIDLPNSWNFAFYFPTFLRIYLLMLCFPGMFAMMTHMNSARYKKLGKIKIKK
ncbi:hypothetical protein TSAR_012345 [Trichomalopsis sarcophagae]|uniref:Very-long-chain (3R)-3-hydroxyacyl-CoA dehydratase n=1 Tax=Trichomalopsis sarcophagae TaxID=543379 RepID=A0A232EWK8_9HYME|nr:hypothetical protein TSAR_012345 [Trichomalopsis sarcophagae]